MNLPLIIACVTIVLALIVFPLIVSFKAEKYIPRCVAINLKPQTDDNSLNLLQLLKKTYNHFDMGIYLTALDDGEINIGNQVTLEL